MVTSLSSQNTIPVTEARTKLGNLVSKVKGEDLFLLTKRGRPKAVLVDVKYWEQLLSRVKKLYQRTFINPQLLPYTREFSDKEIEQWLKEDQL